MSAPEAANTPPEAANTPTREALTREAPNRPATSSAAPLSDFEHGLLVGLLVGEGSFGGDGRQPQISLRMHTRHEGIFRWLMDRFPATRLYGPYHHGGRSYYQWMARGEALVRDVLPLLEDGSLASLDEHARRRFEQMCERYSAYIERERAKVARREGV